MDNLKITGKSLSAALTFTSINPQYDNRLFMEFPWKITSAEHGQNMFCDCSFYGHSMNNLLSCCGIVGARMSASEKDLPVPYRLSKKCVVKQWPYEQASPKWTIR